MIPVTRTIRVANSAAQVNGKQRYAVNSVSYVEPDTPLKLADHFKIGGVFRLGSISDNPTGAKVYLDTSVMAADFQKFVEIVFENKESTVQSWHLDGYNFWVVGYIWRPFLKELLLIRFSLSKFLAFGDGVHSLYFLQDGWWELESR